MAFLGFKAPTLEGIVNLVESKAREAIREGEKFLTDQPADPNTDQSFVSDSPLDSSKLDGNEEELDDDPQSRLKDRAPNVLDGQTTSGGESSPTRDQDYQARLVHVEEESAAKISKLADENKKFKSLLKKLKDKMEEDSRKRESEINERDLAIQEMRAELDHAHNLHGHALELKERIFHQALVDVEIDHRVKLERAERRAKSHAEQMLTTDPLIDDSKRSAGDFGQDVTELTELKAQVKVLEDDIASRMQSEKDIRAELERVQSSLEMTQSLAEKDTHIIHLEQIVKEKVSALSNLEIALSESKNMDKQSEEISALHVTVENHEATVRATEENLVNITQVLELTRQERDLLKDQCGKHEERASAVDNEIASIRSRCDYLEVEKNDLASHLADAMNKLVSVETAPEELENLKARCHEAENERAILEAKVQDLTKRMEFELQAEKAEAARDRADLVSKSTIEAESARTKIEGMEKDLAQALVRISEMENAKPAETPKKVKKVAADLEVKNRELQEVTVAFERVQQELAEAQSKIESLQSAMDAKKVETELKANIEAEIDLASKEVEFNEVIAKLQTELMGTSEKLVETETALASKDGEKQRIESEFIERISALDSRIKELESFLEEAKVCELRMTERSVLFESELKDTQNLVEKARAGEQQMAEKATSLESKIKDLERALEEAEKSVTPSAELDVLRAELLAKERILVDLQNMLDPIHVEKLLTELSTVNMLVESETTEKEPQNQILATFKAPVGSTQSEMDSRAEIVASLKAFAEGMQARLAERETVLDRLEAELKMSKSNNNDEQERVDAEMSSLKTKNCELEQEVHETGRKLGHMESELGETRDKLNKFDAEAIELRNKCSQLESQFADEQSKAGQMESDLGESREKCSHLESELAILKDLAANQALSETQLATAREESINVRADLEAMIAAKQELEVRVASVDQDRALLEAELAQLKEHTLKADTAFAAMGAQLEEAQREIQTSKASADQWKREADVLRSASESLMADLEAATVAKAEAEKARDEFTARLTEATSAGTRLLELEGEKHALADQLDAVQQELSKFRVKADSALAALSGEMESLRTTLDQRDGDLAIAKEEVEILKTRQMEGMDAARDRVVQMESDCMKLKEDAAIAMAEREKMVTELVGFKRERSELQVRFEQVEAERAQLSETVAKMEEELRKNKQVAASSDDSSKRLKVLEAEMNDLRSTLHGEQARFKEREDDLKRQVEGLQAKIVDIKQRAKDAIKEAVINASRRDSGLGTASKPATRGRTNSLDSVEAGLLDQTVDSIYLVPSKEAMSGPVPASRSSSIGNSAGGASIGATTSIGGSAAGPSSTSTIMMAPAAPRGGSNADAGGAVRLLAVQVRTAMQDAYRRGDMSGISRMKLTFGILAYSVIVHLVLISLWWSCRAVPVA